MASGRLKKAGKGSVVGGTSGALVGAGVGSQFGRLVLFAGAMSGVGAPAIIALAIAGSVAGAVGGAIVGATMDGDK